MASKICTACGYEGEAFKRPDDSAGESGSETREAFDKLSRVFSVLTFVPIKPIALLISLPMYVVLWPVKRAIKGDGKKWCPNCGLPTMVKKDSDAGWLAQRKNDIKAGLVVEEKKVDLVAFGRDIKLPGDEEKPAAPPKRKPERLPSLEEMLKETPELPAAPEAAPAEQPKPKKPVDPDQF